MECGQRFSAEEVATRRMAHAALRVPRDCQHPFEALELTHLPRVRCTRCGENLLDPAVYASALREVERLKDCAGGLAG